jgi:hypothetical protein
MGRASEPDEMFDRPLEPLNWEARADDEGQPESVHEAISPE